MKIYKTYKDKEKWFEITDEEFKKNFKDWDFEDRTALQFLKVVGTLQTNWAVYSIKKSF
jgi:hypothetical protein